MDFLEKLFTLASDASVAPACFAVLKKRSQNKEDKNYAKIQEYLGRIWFANDLEIRSEDTQLVSDDLFQNI